MGKIDNVFRFEISRSCEKDLGKLRSLNAWFLTLLTTIALPSSGACADTDQTQQVLASKDLFTPSFKALFLLFILAVILESGLAIIFNWKLFFTVFDSKATKPLVAILAASGFVFYYNLDIAAGVIPFAGHS
jgi:hypothetical protein